MKRAVLAVAMLAVLVSCDSSRGGGEPVDDQLTEAKVSLAAGDIAGAKAVYTAIIDDGASAQVTKATDPNNAEARFGRAFCNILLLMESAPFDAILAGFGQSPWKLDTVFGDSGYLKLSLTDPSSVLPSLPFYTTKKECHAGKIRCIPSHVVAGYTSKDLFASFGELTPYVDSIISDLLVAIKTSSASYTIPKELYSGDADIPVNHADMVQILAGAYSFNAGIDFLNSWTFDMDLSALVGPNGVGLIGKEEAVSILNEQFALRSDNLLVSARTNLQNWAEYSKQATGEVLEGSTGGILNLSADNEELYQNFYDMMGSMVSSFSGSVAIVDIQPEVTANIDAFFNSPPDGAAIASDPFVLNDYTPYGGGKQIAVVEAFWNEMISKACNFTIGTKTKVLTDAARAIQRPYYQLFNTIMGHTFGKFRAGRGA